MVLQDERTSAHGRPVQSVANSIAQFGGLINRSAMPPTLRASTLKERGRKLKERGRKLKEKLKKIPKIEINPPCAPRGMYITPRYILASAVFLTVPLIVLEFISVHVGIGLFILSSCAACFGRTVGRQSKAKWKAAASLWPAKLPAPHKVERTHIVNRHDMLLRRFTIRAQNPKAACVLVHGYGQSTHFEFLTATHPGGPHSAWDGSILQVLVDNGISVFAMDLQVHNPCPTPTPP